MNVNLPKIAQVVVGLPVEGPFDYAIGRDLQKSIAAGCRVRISFNRRNRIGFVVGLKQKSSFKNLKPILSVPDSAPILGDKALKFTKTFSGYYGCSWGEAIETYLPRALRKGRSMVSESLADVGAAAGPKIKDPFLLIHDKSGNQSWPFLLDQMQATLKNRRSVIVLIPETSFLETVLSRLKEPFASSWTILDKTLAPQKELEQWIKIKKSNAVVVVGTRSAVFAPVSDVGLIVIFDEEHRTYKQEQSPHYHARDVAFLRAGLEQCRVILISATPSAEVWEMAKKSGWQKMTFEANGLATMQTVDMTNYNPRRSSLISFPLQNSIQKTLENKGKIVLLMNRRGFSTRTQCPQCGFQLKCERCDANLIYLYSKRKMVCRLCQYQTALPKVCPQCQGSYLRSTGMGIEKLESEVARLYPQASVTRYDRESASLSNKADIIIGTQAILKELGRLAVDLIAVIQFDAELHRLDFRSAQKAFALLVHLRQLAKEKLLIQTHMTDNYVLKAAQKMDFSYFYRQELKYRRELNFPPYRHLVAVGLRAAQEDVVFEQSKTLYERLSQRGLKTIEVSDPHPDVIAKLRGKYRYTILLKGKSVKGILTFVKSVLKDFKRKKNTIITINVDP